MGAAWTTAPPPIDGEGPDMLPTVHVFMRSDGDDRGNPSVRPRGEKGDGCLIAEQLEALPSGRPAEQLAVEVVGLSGMLAQMSPSSGSGI